MPTKKIKFLFFTNFFYHKNSRKKNGIEVKI